MTAIIAFSFLKVLRLVLEFYQWALFIYALLSMLVLFNVVNYHNQLIFLLNSFLRRLLEPILQPLRSILPSTRGLDLSFLVLYFLVYFLQKVIELTMRHMLASGAIV